MKKMIIMALLVTGIPIVSTQCADESTEVTFKVICTGTADNPGTFSGYYSIDGGDEHSLNGSIEQIDAYTYRYKSGTFSNFDELEIYAKRDSYDADLVIKIYEDGEKVKTTTLSADSYDDDSDIDYLMIDYEYEEGQDSSSDDD